MMHMFCLPMLAGDEKAALLWFTGVGLGVRAGVGEG